MSGVEIAGLALGAFPIIIEALKGLLHRVDKFRHFRDIRQQSSYWLQVVKSEWINFKRTMEFLLLQSNIERPGPRLDALIKDSGLENGVWRNPENDDLLKDYLVDSYDVYKEWVTTLHLSLRRIEKKLCIEERLPGNDVPRSEGSSWSKRRKELRLVFSSTGIDEQLSRIEKMNMYLRQLTRDIEDLHYIKPDASSHTCSIEGDVRTIRKYYVSLWESLRECGLSTCDCEQVHFASLRLEPKPVVLKREITGRDYEDPFFNFKVLLVSKRPEVVDDTDVHFQEFEIRPLGCDAQGDGVHFTHLPWPNEGPQVQDVCTDLVHFNTCNEESSIGFLADVKVLSLRQRFHPLTWNKELRPSNLKELLDQSTSAPQRHWLTRCDRLSLAVTLACTMLQLGETAWLQKFWSSADIVLMHPEGEVCRDIDSQDIFPYLDWSLSALKGHVDEGFDLSKEAANFVRSKPLLALGLTLVELCMGQSLSSIREAEDYEASVVGTNFTTAKRFLHEVELQEGPLYRSIVERCLHSNFQTEKFDFGDDKFHKILIENVVLPLVRLWNDFRGFDSSTSQTNHSGTGPGRSKFRKA